MIGSAYTIGSMQSDFYEWEIYLPSTGIPYAKHLEWDRYVMVITNGLTLHNKVVGKWLDPSEKEESIRVRLVCNEAQIIHIAQWSKHHYNQTSILIIQRGRAFLI
jgi:hypothetical protein